MELSTAAFLTAFLAAIYKWYPQEVDPSFKPRDVPQNELKDEYDFIIVGAGSAGCVVANRLSQIPSWSVLVIEAGGDESAITDTPLFTYNLTNTIYDWNYTTVPQKRACLANGGICQYPRGHVMGGSSAINILMYVRGNRADYDGWAKLGNVGWSYEDVLPYFIKAEHTTEPNLAASPYHGTSGPLHVQYPKYYTSLREEYLKAGEELGWIHRDYNGEIQNNSVGYNQMTIDGPSRDSASKAYLNIVRKRKNLAVIKNSLVTKIITDKSNKLATGVVYIRNGKKYTIKAKKEVIISAGAINSPKLLMLSGIGPNAEMKKHRIPLVADLPVGKHLQDHVLVTVFFLINKNVTITSDVWKTNESIFEYAKKRKGPLTTIGLETLATINPEEQEGLPNMGIAFSSFLPEYLNPQHLQIIWAFIALATPKSRGTVKLKSKNPYDEPLIDPNYFAKQYDYETFQKGIEVVFKFMNTSVMQNYSPQLFTAIHPLCNQKNQEDFIKCMISQYSQTCYHPVGSVKMGPPNDKTSVVDPKLMVKGFKNLRVVDASIMPIIPRANTNAPTIMIAEKASDIIKYHNLIASFFPNNPFPDINIPFSDEVFTGA